MNKTIALLLILLLALPAFGRERTIEEQIRRVKLGSGVEVTLVGGERLRGRMGSVSNAGFFVEPEHSGPGASRTVQFDQVLRINGVHQTEKLIGKTVAIVAVATVGTIGLIVLLILHSAHG